MKAVFLDRATFSTQAVLSVPQGITEYQVFDMTANDPQLIIERAKEADILITNKVKMGKEVVEALPRLKLIQLTATGMDNVDVQACCQQGILVYNVAGYSLESVPEHTFMLMLSAMRAGNHYHRQVIDGTWQQSAKFCLLDTPILDLANRTLGIIGKGAIGQRVGQIATAFGMTVLYAERQGKSPRDSSYVLFEEVLERSEIISLHCPLTAQTHHLINHTTVSLMKKQPLIVNVSRGEVVDSQAIVHALNTGQILGYASDVFADEPILADDPILKLCHHPRVIFTPHNAWGSLNAQQRLWQILSEQISKFIKNTDSQVDNVRD